MKFDNNSKKAIPHDEIIGKKIFTSNPDGKSISKRELICNWNWKGLGPITNGHIIRGYTNSYMYDADEKFYYPEEIERKQEPELQEIISSNYSNKYKQQEINQRNWIKYASEREKEDMREETDMYRTVLSQKCELWLTYNMKNTDLHNLKKLDWIIDDSSYILTPSIKTRLNPIITYAICKDFIEKNKGIWKMSEDIKSNPDKYDPSKNKQYLQDNLYNITGEQFESRIKEIKEAKENSKRIKGIENELYYCSRAMENIELIENWQKLRNNSRYKDEFEYGWTYPDIDKNDLCYEI